SLGLGACRLGLSNALALGGLALGFFRRLAQRRLLGLGLLPRFLLRSLPLRLDVGQGLLCLPLGLGFGFRLSLRLLLGLTKGCSVRLGLALRRFLGDALGSSSLLIALTGVGLALCVDARLEVS